MALISHVYIPCVHNIVWCGLLFTFVDVASQIVFILLASCILHADFDCGHMNLRCLFDFHIEMVGRQRSDSGLETDIWICESS